MGPTERVANLIVAFRLESAPERAIAVAKQNILDSVGVTLAGTGLDAGRIATAYVRTGPARRRRA